MQMFQDEAATAAARDDVLVLLNIGGQRFEAPRAALLSAGDDTFFAAALSGRHSLRTDGEGALTVERHARIHLKGR